MLFSSLHQIVKVVKNLLVFFLKLLNTALQLTALKLIDRFLTLSLQKLFMRQRIFNIA